MNRTLQPTSFLQKNRGLSFDACGYKLTPKQVKFVCFNADLLNYDYKYASDYINFSLPFAMAFPDEDKFVSGCEYLVGERQSERQT